MRPRTIVEKLRQCEVTVTVIGDRIRLEPGSLVPRDLADELRRHKNEVIDYLHRGSQEREAYARGAKDSQVDPTDCSSAGEVQARLLAWASETAEEGIVLANPVRYVEALLRTVETVRVSDYATSYLRTIAYARLHQATGGWDRWTPQWWKERESQAMGALHALRNAVTDVPEGEQK